MPSEMNPDVRWIMWTLIRNSDSVGVNPEVWEPRWAREVLYSMAMILYEDGWRARDYVWTQAEASGSRK